MTQALETTLSLKLDIESEVWYNFASIISKYRSRRSTESEISIWAIDRPPDVKWVL
ncbi:MULTISPECIES: hypothetical protein [unclassified Microcoleus]|uniref:hypothetical protein n=1 Tax=unclassified Microcoleus TaxID=2642155 RepID=UPI002FCFD72C